MGFKLFIATIFLTIAGFNVVESDAKIDCHPLDGATKEKCEALGCIWSPVESDLKGVQNGGLSFNLSGPYVDQIQGGLVGSNIREPWCFMPEEYAGYQVTERGSSRIKLSRVQSSGLPDDVQEVQIDLEHISDSIARIKIYDPKNKRFEPKLPELNKGKLARIVKPKVKLAQGDQNYIVLVREETGAPIFKTDLRKLIFSNKFIQLNSKLNSTYLFGLGEHYDSFVKKTDAYKAYSFYATDKLTLPGGERSYGSFPFYISFDSENGKHAHGVYLHNKNAMDIVVQPDQSITFRPIGGILDFYFFIGPTANEVIEQYQNFVGLPILPPRWSLGFHLCRYDYKTLAKTKLVWQRTRDSKIPFDVQWNDIDNMERHNDFTYDKERFAGLPEFVDELHANNMHYMILFDPGLSQEENYYPYTLGVEMDIFIKNATNQTLVGKVWNDSGRTVFPDFSNEKSHEYWAKLFEKFQQELKFDGAWIDMNEISNFVYGSLSGCPSDHESETTPYKPGGYDLQEHSLCLSAKLKEGTEFDLHNLYSFYEAIATKKALEVARPNKRPFILSRASTPGQGAYSGHWSGDVLSNWDYLRWSIPSLIEHSMYGFSMMGSDICGFVGNTNVELCSRWSTLGAFYTFTRNHNDDVSIDQDPVALGPIVVEANRNALTKRYSLLPYLYTLIFKASKYGEPVVRSIPLEFHQQDKEALNVEDQFLWGKGLMISPIVEPNTHAKSTYLPRGRWYETNVLPISNGSSSVKVPKWVDSEGEWYITKDVPLDDIILFYRGGHILPMYSTVHQTIAETVSSQPIGLEVALCQKNKAFGDLYMDDGDNVDGKANYAKFSFENNQLTIKLIEDNYKPSLEFGKVLIYGIGTPISQVKLNGQPITFERVDHVLSFNLNGISVSEKNDAIIELS